MILLVVTLALFRPTDFPWDSLDTPGIIAKCCTFSSRGNVEEGLRYSHTRTNDERRHTHTRYTMVNTCVVRLGYNMCSCPEA